MENHNWTKLKDDFAAIIIGVIVSLPAIGIVIPQIFSVFGDQEGMKLSALFRLFSMVYFTTPLIILFVLSFFQFTNDVLVKLRKMVWGIIALIAIVFILSVFLGSQYIDLVITFVIVLLLSYYWYNFIKTSNEVIKGIETCKNNIIVKENKLNTISGEIGDTIADSLPDATPASDNPQATENNTSALPPSLTPETLQQKQIKEEICKEKEKLWESYTTIKLSIFYLFIVSQLSVVLTLVLFNKLSDNLAYMWILILPYAAVLCYYLLNRDLKNLQQTKEISSSFLPFVLGGVILSIGLIFYTSKSSSTISLQNFNQYYQQHFSGIDLAGRLHVEIKILDDSSAGLRLKEANHQLNMRSFIYLKEVLKSDSITTDSLQRLDARILSYYYFIDKKAKSDSGAKADDVPHMKEFWAEYIRLEKAGKTELKKNEQKYGAETDEPKVDDTVGALLQKIVKLRNFVKKEMKASKKAKVDSLKHYTDLIKSDKFYKTMDDSNSIRLLKFSSSKEAIQLKRQNLNIEDALLNNKIKLQQINLIKDLQHVGIIIFTTTLIIIAAFLLILSYKDDQYQIETLPEIKPIKRILQAVCLIIAILLVPLVKIVPEEQVNPEKPSSIFLISNWNLAKAMPESEESVSTPRRRHADPFTEAKEFYGECCCDTLRIKFVDSAFFSVNKPLIELIGTLDTNAKMMNAYLANMNQFLLNRNNITLTMDNAPILQRMDEANNQYRNISNKIDDLNTSSKMSLSELKDAINSSQYKSKPSNQ